MKRRDGYDGMSIRKYRIARLVADAKPLCGCCSLEVEFGDGGLPLWRCECRNAARCHRCGRCYEHHVCDRGLTEERWAKINRKATDRESQLN